MDLNKFSIFVNTTDSFDDCWLPFFTLFKKFWPEFRGIIYLNTETKSFSFEGLNIVCTRNNVNNNRNNSVWSACLSRGLNIIPEKIILYMQEDYFLHAQVNYKVIDELVEVILSNNIDCIYLTDQSTLGPFKGTFHPQLLNIDNNAKYCVNTQAALWKIDVLKKYIYNHENAWQFEHYASKRAHIMHHNFFNVDVNKYSKGKNEIIPYIYTGIIKGKWNKEVVSLFSRHDLSIDYSKRGFNENKGKNNLNRRIKKFLIEFLKVVKSELSLLILKVMIKNN